MKMDFTGCKIFNLRDPIEVYVGGKQKIENLRKFHCFLQWDFVWQHKNFEMLPCMTVIQKKSQILHEWQFFPLLFVKQLCYHSLNSINSSKYFNYKNCLKRNLHTPHLHTVLSRKTYNCAHVRLFHNFKISLSKLFKYTWIF